MTNPVNVLGKYGMSPWGKSWNKVPNYSFSKSADWIWSTPNANERAPTNEEIHFKYNYNNTSGNNISANFYFIVDNIANIFINRKKVTADYWGNSQIIPIELLKGNNTIEVQCTNLGNRPNSAGFIADVRSSNNNKLLFSTNGEWVYETNFTKNILNVNYCGGQKLNSGFLTHDNVGFDLKNDNEEFKKGSFLLLARQTVPFYFTKDIINTLQYNEHEPNNNNYMNGKLLNDSFKINGSYTFKLVWPSSGLQNQIWSQQSNPFTESPVVGYKDIYIPYRQNHWGGLRKNGKQCVLSGSTNENWYYAVCSFQQWSSGIPGPYSAVQKVELYVLKGDIGNYTSLGYNWIPSSISWDSNIPHEHCANKCDSMSKCTGFTKIKWLNNDKGCNFFNNSERKFNYPYAIAYNKKPTSGALKDTIISSNKEIRPLGVWGDGPNRALPYYLGNVGKNIKACAERANSNGLRYIGLQCPGCGVQCFAGNNLNHAKKYGRRKFQGGYGGSWINSIYDTKINKKSSRLTNERGCAISCNKTKGCVGYSFDKNKSTDNCTKFKKLPEYYYANNNKKIGFRPGNISNFSSLSKEKQNDIKKKCGAGYLSKKYNIDENVINKCIETNNYNNKTTGYNVNAECLYDDLKNNPKTSTKETITGLNNMSIIRSGKNKNIDSEIDDFYKYVDKNSEFSNYNNKEIIKNSDNNRENTEFARSVYESGSLDYLKNAVSLDEDITELVNNSEQNIEKFNVYSEETNTQNNKINVDNYFKNIQYNNYKWIIFTIILIILIILMYYFNY